MVFIDSNVLLHAVNSSSAEHTLALETLTRTVNGDKEVFVSWSVLYEFLRVSTHHKVFAHPLSFKKATDFVRTLVSEPNVTVISETAIHVEMLLKSSQETVRLAGNMVHDLHHAVLMREHGIRDIITFDHDFHAFPWIRAIVPH